MRSAGRCTVFPAIRGWALDEIGGSDPELTKQFMDLRQAIEDLRKTMLQGDTPGSGQGMKTTGTISAGAFTDMRTTFQLLQIRTTVRPLQIADLPRAFRDQFLSAK